MKINKKGETLVSIIVWVFILSFVVLWIWTLIWNSRDLLKKYNTKTKLDFVTNNSYNIINNIDISSTVDWEVFYLYKNISDFNNKFYEIKVWESNSEYKYIDEFWEKVDNPLYYKGILFLRLFYSKKITVDWIEKTAVKWIIRELKK